MSAEVYEELPFEVSDHPFSVFTIMCSVVHMHSLSAECLAKVTDAFATVSSNGLDSGGRA